jgi:hypothetical protein
MCGSTRSVKVVPRRLAVPRVRGIAHDSLLADDTRIGNGTPEETPPGCKRRDPLVPANATRLTHSRMVVGSAGFGWGYGESAGGRQGVPSMRSCRTPMAFLPCLRAVSM